MYIRGRKAVSLVFLILAAVFVSGASCRAASLSKEKMKLYVGRTKTLNVKDYDGPVTWSSSREEIVTVVSSEGNAAVLQGKKAGNAVITAKIGKKKLRCNVRVPRPSYYLKVKKKTVIIDSGKTKSVKVKAQAKRAVAELRVKSYDRSVAEAEIAGSKIRITGKGGGATTVKVKFGNKKALIRVVVKETAGDYVAGRELQGNNAVLNSEFDLPSGIVLAFISTLMEMDTLMRADNAAGRQWRYKNKNTYLLSRNFDAARTEKNYYTNCVTAVQWGLLRCGAVDANRDGIQWYGNKGIVWLGANAEANAKKYFNIIKVGNKTVKQCLDDGTLQPGDIITYTKLAHTNVYLGEGLSFDSGHVNCLEGGEGARFLRWIRETPYLGYKVAAILRLKQ